MRRDYVASTRYDAILAPYAHWDDPWTGSLAHKSRHKSLHYTDGTPLNLLDLN